MEGAREAVAHQVLVTDPDGPYALPPRARRRGRPRRPAAGRGHRAARADRGGARALPRAARRRARRRRSPPSSPATGASAHELSRALGASVRAGRGAKRVYAYEEAGRQFERALELWDARARRRGARRHGPRRAAAARRDVRERPRARRRAPSRSSREALAAIDEQRRAGARRAAATSGSGTTCARPAQGRESLAAFDRAVALLPPGPSDERARVLEERARVEMLLGEFEPTLRDRHAGDRRGARRRRRADRPARADHARLRARRARRRGRGHRDDARRVRAARWPIDAPADRSRAAVNLVRAARPHRPDRGGARGRARGARGDAAAPGADQLRRVPDDPGRPTC